MSRVGPGGLLAAIRDDGAVRLRFVVVGAAVVALGGVSLAIARGGRAFSFAATAAGSAALLIAGWSLVAAGLVFWVTRPGNRTGAAAVADERGLVAR